MADDWDLNQYRLRRRNELKSINVNVTSFGLERFPVMVKGDVNKPKGKTSAYAYFVQTCRDEHKRKTPDVPVNFAAFSKKCSERWRSLTAPDKIRI
ncbi:hypothetical protein AALO_G00294530 [Alosa alosa]|uniref:HMG box domain-containing protein n=1 Tax=Alosa alosa TaxID=278164 RepID=A0AAV6FDN0_9TELE|nr:hypothetical protein AALO_G00294530 [Alosa alosa]